MKPMSTPLLALVCTPAAAPSGPGAPADPDGAATASAAEFAALLEDAGHAPAAVVATDQLVPDSPATLRSIAPAANADELEAALNADGPARTPNGSPNGDAAAPLSEAPTDNAAEHLRTPP